MVTYKYSQGCFIEINEILTNLTDLLKLSSHLVPQLLKGRGEAKLNKSTTSNWCIAAPGLPQWPTPAAKAHSEHRGAASITSSATWPASSQWPHAAVILAVFSCPQVLQTILFLS